MKVTYEQAVRLKDAGFPQPGDVDQHSMDSRYENGVYIPTENELRLATGYFASEIDAVIELYIAQKHNVN